MTLNPFTPQLRSGRAILESPLDFPRLRSLRRSSGQAGRVARGRSILRRSWRPVRRLALHAPTRQRWVSVVVFVTFLPNMTGLASMLSVRAAAKDAAPVVEHSRALTTQEMQMIAGTVTVAQPPRVGSGKPWELTIEEIYEVGGTKPADAGVGLGCGTCGSNGGTGGSVSMKTKNGNFSKTVVSVPALGMPLAFTVFQNSFENYYSPVGWTWEHTYDMWLEEDVEMGEGWVNLREADGTRHHWDKNADGSYTAEAGLFDTLVKESNAEFTVTRAGNRDRLHFSDTGPIRRLYRWEDRHSKGLNFGYDSNGSLSTITDQASRTITLAYDSSKRVTTITDPASHSASLTYDSTGRHHLERPAL